ncbi:TIGR03826 family flagellar region protein [Dethiothermospora halolimnae]|uniref:TIGR03826 family flagellar region protein n=1 Tax=Dethiothermospora halolimnae TaxID=3114390 RepID=UPI003CCBCE08
MELKNCKKCGRIYAYDGYDSCSRCRQSDEEEFRRVKEYIYEHPGATIHEVSEETEVSKNKILKFLRAGRLEIKGDDANLILDCERCGKSIKTGRFCNQCTAEMQREFKSAVAPKKSPENERKKREDDRMYIAKRRKR